QVDVDPAERRRKRESPGPRVQAGGEIEHEIDAAALQLLHDDLVEDGRANDHRPCHLPAAFHRRDDFFPALAGELPRERVVEDPVRAVGLHGTVDGDPARGIGDVFDGHGWRTRYFASVRRQTVAPHPGKAGARTDADGGLPRMDADELLWALPQGASRRLADFVETNRSNLALGSQCRT